MNIDQLQRASDLANVTGVKILCYGPPGAGKTPVSITAPKPIILATETGLLSLRGNPKARNVPVYMANTPAKAFDFLDWWHTDPNADRFETLIIDSISQLADMVIDQQMALYKGDGDQNFKAYNNMQTMIFDAIERIDNQPVKHAFLIAKEETLDSGMRRPYFPGKKLHVRIPHLLDVVTRLGLEIVPEHGEKTAFRTVGNFKTVARDRSGKLKEIEYPDVANVIRKVMTAA